MPVQIFVTTSAMTLSRYHEIRRPFGTAADRWSGTMWTLGRNWYWFAIDLFNHLPERRGVALTPLWETEDRGTTRIYLGSPRVLTRDTYDDETWVADVWSPYKQQVRDLFDVHFCPRPSRPVEIVALEGGTIHREPKDTGALHIVFHAGTSPTEYVGRFSPDHTHLRAIGQYPVSTLQHWFASDTAHERVYLGGHPVANLIEDHTVLILPDILAIARDDSARRDMIRQILQVTGDGYVRNAARLADMRRRDPIPTPIPGAPKILVKVHGSRVKNTQFLDVPAGLTISGVLHHCAGVDELMARHCWVRLNGVRVPTTDVPRDGDTITIEA